MGSVGADSCSSLFSEVGSSVTSFGTLDNSDAAESLASSIASSGELVTVCSTSSSELSLSLERWSGSESFSTPGIVVGSAATTGSGAARHSDDESVCKADTDCPSVLGRWDCFSSTTFWSSTGITLSSTGELLIKLFSTFADGSLTTSFTTTTLSQLSCKLEEGSLDSKELTNEASALTSGDLTAGAIVVSFTLDEKRSGDFIALLESSATSLVSCIRVSTGVSGMVTGAAPVSGKSGFTGESAIVFASIVSSSAGDSCDVGFVFSLSDS